MLDDDAQYQLLLYMLGYLCAGFYLLFWLLLNVQGLAKYNNVTAVINASVFHPSQLTEDRMLYFWISDEVFNTLITASHQDGRFVLNISGLELTVGVYQTSGSHVD